MDNLTIIIPFYNGHQHIAGLLSDLANYDLPVILVDDVSDTPFDVTKIPAKPKRFISMRLETKGYFTGACNAGIAACETDVLILNQDIRLTGTGWIDMIANNRDKYVMIGEKIPGDNPSWPNGYIHGTFMFMRRDALDKVGLMNAELFPLWGSTCEWQLRACRAGYKVLPIRPVPSFSHTRIGNFGSSIKTLLQEKPDLKDLMIRVPPLVSVIVPCHNYGRYLPDLVASMMGGNTSLGYMPGQTFQAFEMIIVDDGSNDGETHEIITSLVNYWKGIKAVYRETKGGINYAINAGVAISHGRALSIVDADDMMMPERLEKMYKLWEEDKTRVVYDDMQTFAHGEKKDVMYMREYDFDFLIKKNIMHCGIMYARSAFDNVGGYPIEMTHGRQDWAMNIKLGMHGYCGHHLRETLYLYRREGQNQSMRNSTKDWSTVFRAQIEALFPELYEGNYPMACCGKKKTQVISSPVKPLSNVKVSKLPGGSGMVLLRYIGASHGTQTFYGAVSGARYKFGLSSPLGYVDVRDQAGFLSMHERDKNIFKVEKVSKFVSELVTPATAQVVAGKVQPSIGDPGTVEEIKPQDETIPVVKDLDISALTVAQVRELMAKVDQDIDIRCLIDAERKGKNRSTVIKALSAAI